MIAQAVLLFRLVQDIDEVYLDERISFETSGEAGLSTLKMWASDNEEHEL